MYTDTGDGILGTNMYAYCQNDPVNKWDPGGTDAYYVIIYGSGGVPVVGHSRLFLQDAKGVWWVTEYTGYGENIFDAKKEARVRTWQATAVDWARIKIPKNSNLTDGASNVLIKGNFTKSLELAKIYDKLDNDRLKNGQSLKKSRFGGGFGYNVVFNNCQHYTGVILNEGVGIPKPISDVFLRLPLQSSIPSVFFAHLLFAVRMVQK